MNPKKDLQKHADKSFTLKLTLAQSEINTEYQKVLRSLQTTFKMDGFRTGKVPLNIIADNVSSEKIIDEISSHLLSHVYEDILKEEKLSPIIQPKVTVDNQPLTFDKDWQFTLESCEAPAISIDTKVFDQIKKINSQIEIVNPKEDQATKTPTKINQIMDLLVKFTKIKIPAILADPKDKDKVKEWTINLAFDQIAKDNKLEVTTAEVEALLAKNPQLKQNISLVYYLLHQQKIIDYLKSLK